MATDEKYSEAIFALLSKMLSVLLDPGLFIAQSSYCRLTNAGQLIFQQNREIKCSLSRPIVNVHKQKKKIIWLPLPCISVNRLGHRYPVKLNR